ncbi:MAG TPA: DegT/DnrJ/EryC1/StrS family aminotransferase [Mycobacteriales bacterium]|jgi:dTDP-4-amino-4,6-dideoxygalactose transaminase/nucleoside-diphosphate-sugar epimerase|nr:DegT/DnrJ/EryC1/StrS family aminotransferase [Mycobacteriales bacterium]
MECGAVTVVGGAGFLGSAVGRRAAVAGRPVTSMDRLRAVSPRLPATVDQRGVDLLIDPMELPDGLVVLASGGSDPRAGDPWRLVLDNVVTTARLLPALAGREVVLISSVEVYGAAQDGLPLDDAAIGAWCDELRVLARRPCPPWQVAELCRELAAADPTGRWVYGLAKRAQELLVRTVVPPDRLSVLRAANLFGPGQDRVVAQLSRRALAGLPLAVTDAVRTFLPVDDLARVVLDGGAGTLDAGLAVLPLVELAGLVLDTLGLDAPVAIAPPPTVDVCGRIDTAEFVRRLGAGDGAARLERELRSFVGRLADEELPAFAPALPVVLPPRPRRPDEVAYRTQACLETGSVKGGPWASALTEGLREALDLPPESALLVTASGSAALRLAVQAIAGPVGFGDVAVLPSFTFAATGEMLAQLGYTLRFCDVRPDTWTMDPASLATALEPGDVSVVVAVDTLGAPADYAALTKVCADAGVPLVADSAAALGASHQGRPVATQAAAHSYSLSFAKVLSAGGGGGALVLPREAVERLRTPMDWLRSVPMVETAAIAALDLLADLDLLVARRRDVAARYAEIGTALGVVPHRAADGDEHAWVHWVARFGDVDRDRLAAELLRLGVATKPYYAPPLHWHDWRGYAETAGPLPVSDQLGREALALPMSSEISPLQADRVTTAVLTALATARR